MRALISAKVTEPYSSGSRQPSMFKLVPFRTNTQCVMALSLSADKQ
jgi:hypothetical protein